MLHVGVTNDSTRRMCQHRETMADGFTRKYNVIELVYYEVPEGVANGINGWLRAEEDPVDQ
jgi:putative endonuclease